MGSFNMFIIRLILSVLFSVIILRMFSKDMAPLKVIGLAAVLLGFAYLFQYTKKRDKGGRGGK